MRYAFVKEIESMAAKNKDLVLLTGDLGFTVFEDFARKFPKQFFNVGIAESNMMGVAAGLALSGKRVFAYSIATFASYRPFEFIRDDICLHNLPVVVVGSGAGFSYGDAGPTHQAVEDIAIMRTLPNISVLCPCDPIEAAWATKQAFALRRPVYLRLGKKGEPDLHLKDPKLKFGTLSKIKHGKNFSVLACGNIVSNAKEALDILKKDGLAGSLYSVHTIKPIDKKTIIELAKRDKFLITVEEHRTSGGLGGAVSEIVSQLGGKHAQHYIIGADDAFYRKTGSHDYLRELHGLSVEKIAERIGDIISSR